MTKYEKFQNFFLKKKGLVQNKHVCLRKTDIKQNVNIL